MLASSVIKKILNLLYGKTLIWDVCYSVCYLSAFILPGSDEEREAFKKANHQNKLLHQNQNPGLHLTIKVTSDVRKGSDFDVFAVVTNNTQSDKKCRLVFGSCAVSYSGFMGGNCGFKDLLNIELSPGAGQTSCCAVFMFENVIHLTFKFEINILCVFS